MAKAAELTGEELLVGDALAAVDEASADADLIPEGKLVCAVTGEQRVATPQEETFQSFVEQLHREYGVPLDDLGRDVKVPCAYEDPKSGKEKVRKRTVSLVVYEHGAARTLANIIRVGIIAQPSVKPGAQTLTFLEDILGNLSPDRPEVFGLWTNGTELAFRMRTFHTRTGQPQFTELTDFPAPDETLEDLESGTRRPLRVAAGDSLLRTFRRCHDYLYGNQSMRGDRAFWQLLYLIFCKIYDEQQSSRFFFVGATEANSDEGLKRERGQFFTPRNVIRMMVEMIDPQSGTKVFDPACGSGGFLVVALAHVRRQFLQTTGGHPDLPVSKELKRVDLMIRKYARSCLYGTDVDPDLRKAARMNMVMNNDGHGNIFNFNSLEYGVPDRRTPETAGGRESLVERQLVRLLSPQFWVPCNGCQYRDKCPLKHNADSLGDPNSGPAARERVRRLFEMVHLRRRMHMTIRDVRSFEG